MWRLGSCLGLLSYSEKLFWRLRMQNLCLAYEEHDWAQTLPITVMERWDHRSSKTDGTKSFRSSLIDAINFLRWSWTRAEAECKYCHRSPLREPTLAPDRVEYILAPNLLLLLYPFTSTLSAHKFLQHHEDQPLSLLWRKLRKSVRAIQEGIWWKLLVASNSWRLTNERSDTAGKTWPSDVCSLQH